jgi:hypothetical protein
MVAILARAGHVELVERLLAKVRADGILLPFATVRLVIDFAQLAVQAAGTELRRRGLAVCPADTRGPQEIEVRIYFPTGVDMQSWASIFSSWICKWDLKASC